MKCELRKISRYPVKGLSEEILTEVEVTKGRGLPGDRQFALALADTEFDPLNPHPLPKTMFVMLARFATLAGLSSSFDPVTSTLVLRAAGTTLAAGCLKTQTGRRAIEEAVARFMGNDLGGLPRVVEAEGHRFTDVSVDSPVLMEAVSMVNLTSVRDLEDKLGRAVDPRRFRANLLVDGLDPWQEFDLIDKEFAIGGVRVKGLRRTRRCPATEVNPDTAERDIRIPLELRRHYGHGDNGIYVSILSNGALRQGDEVATDGAHRSPQK